MERSQFSPAAVHVSRDCETAEESRRRRKARTSPGAIKSMEQRTLARRGLPVVTSSMLDAAGRGTRLFL